MGLWVSERRKELGRRLNLKRPEQDTDAAGLSCTCILGPEQTRGIRDLLVKEVAHKSKRERNSLCSVLSLA